MNFARGSDENNIARGIDYIRLTATTGTYVRTAMRPQQFPVMMSDLLDEILSVQLAERVFSCLRGETAPTPAKGNPCNRRTDAENSEDRPCS